MANGFNTPRSLSDTYVYYEHLEKTYPDMYTKIKSDLENTAFSLGSGGNIGNQLQDAANALQAMAANERKKEQSFIRNTFGADIKFEIDSATDFEDFVDAFNGFMQLKEVYEANKALIQSAAVSSKGNEITNKNAYTYFSGYFADAFKALINDIREALITSAKTNKLSLEENIRKVLNETVEKAVNMALIKLEEVGGLSSVKNIQGYTQQEDETIIAGYRRIAQAINNMGRVEFGKMIIRELGLNSIVDDTINELKKNEGIYNDNGRKKLKTNTLKKAMKNSVKYHSSSQGKNILGGNMLELVENVAVNELGKLKGGGYGITFRAIQTGGTGAKPDNIIYTVDIDTQGMEQIWKKSFQDEEGNTKQVSRKRNIEAAEKLNQALKGATGYIVYSSAKNQTLQSASFKSGGFNSGTPMNMSTFQTVMKKIGKDGQGLTRAIMQTGKGAIGEQEKERLENEIASYLAYFLFDDFQTIGEDIANDSQTNVKYLHVMYLNGVYVPLSVLLKLLANAFIQEAKEVSGSVDSVAKVNITTKPILYNYDEIGFVPPPGAWGIQRDAALADSKVKVRFLKNFKTLMSKIKT